ncbi:MAG: UTP--glucose-1-phosphate uridylyltransferase [Candidatus Pacebacteria bacterium]|nr:UTP--glucose-1-phosphate uridylyltransferase [Candidatus Paceibacterota bacterium]
MSDANPKTEVKKVIIPVAGLGTRFLPMTRIMPKAVLPVVDEPMAAWIVKEAKESGINDITFIVSENTKITLDYFKPKTKLSQILEKRGSLDVLEKLRKMEKGLEGINFSFVVQPEPRGDGDAVLKAKKQVEKEPFGVLFHDDIFFGKQPPISQLIKVFQTSQKPVIGLKKISQDKLSAYGVASVEKIATHLYKIKKIVEKPKPGEAPSDLAFCGRYILTPDIFHYLGKTPLTQKGELILADAFSAMLDDGKVIYGCEIEGDWLECGKTVDWLKSSIFLALQHKEYGPAIREWLKKIK